MDRYSSQLCQTRLSHDGLKKVLKLGLGTLA
jgi:hypothetical protein